MEWSIQILARAAGTSSRTLRHYHERGLLEPHRLGANGMRYYDESALPTLLRILVLRELGLGLTAIGEVLAEDVDTVEALRGHATELEQQRGCLDRQIASVRRTIGQLEAGERLTVEEVLSAFDHTRYRAEVEQRWGAQAYAGADTWWRSMSEADRSAWQAEGAAVAAAYGRLAAAGVPHDGAQTSAVVARHVAQLKGPHPEVSTEYVVGLGEMYVADPRFAAYYPGCVEFVRDAMRAYAQAHLS